MDGELIELITQKVMEQIGKKTSESRPAPDIFESITSMPPEKKILLVVDRAGKEEEEAFRQIRQLGKFNFEWTVLHTPEASPSRTREQTSGVRCKFIENPPIIFDDFVRGFDLVVIPFFSLTAVSRVATLMADNLISSIIFAALREEKQIIAGADQINFYNFYSAIMPKTFLEVLREHLRIVQGFGMKIVEAKGLGSEIELILRSGGITSRSSNVRPVITKEDILIAQRSGNNYLEFPRGTIITPLARETADAAGIEIRIL